MIHLSFKLSRIEDLLKFLIVPDLSVPSYSLRTLVWELIVRTVENGGHAMLGTLSDPFGISFRVSNLRCDPSMFFNIIEDQVIKDFLLLAIITSEDCQDATKDISCMVDLLVW